MGRYSKGSERLVDDKAQKITLSIYIDEDGVVGMEAGENADLFSLIVMTDTIHQLLLNQYIQLAAAKVQQREQFTPKLLVPVK